MEIPTPAHTPYHMSLPAIVRHMNPAEPHSTCHMPHYAIYITDVWRRLVGVVGNLSLPGTEGGRLSSFLLAADVPPPPAFFLQCARMRCCMLERERGMVQGGRGRGWEGYKKAQKKKAGMSVPRPTAAVCPPPSSSPPPPPPLTPPTHVFISSSEKGSERGEKRRDRGDTCSPTTAHLLPLHAALECFVRVCGVEGGHHHPPELH